MEIKEAFEELIIKINRMTDEEFLKLCERAGEKVIRWLT